MARKLRGNSRKAASKCFTRRKPSHSQRRNPDKCLDDKFTIEHISKHGNTTIEIRPGALHHDVACYDENTLHEGRASSTLHQLSSERLTTVDEDFPMGCGLRVGQRKAPKKCFTRCKKRNSCLPGGKSAEVPIFNEEQSAVEDTAFILKPVDCAVASSNPSSCRGNLCQARTSTPSNQLPSDRLPTVRPCSPIDFVSLPTDHDLDHSYLREACSKGANNIAVVPFEVAEVQILYSSEEDSLDASNNLEKSSDIEILESSQENSFDALGESGLEAKTIRSQATVSPAETLKLKELQTHIQRSLPPDWLWIGSVFPGDEGITLFKVPSTGISLLPQRQITILRDGTVHLLVHGNVLSPDHEIWAQLPPKLSFESQSVDNLSGYVLAVVKLVHGYDICPGCPLPQHQNEARKMGAIFCPNLFRERKYSTTHRSVDCGILIVAKTKSTACPTCKTMERNIRKRLARRSSTGSPEATVNNKFLDGPQVKQKLRAEKMLKRNALAREKYYRKKLAVLLGAKGTDVEGGFSEELPEILEHHRNEVLGPEDNSDFS